MKAYRVEVSFELVLSWLRDGVRPWQQIAISGGVPQAGHLIATRMRSESNSLELLFITDEPGHAFPEACDIWDFAEQVTPTVTVETLGVNPSRPIPATIAGEMWPRMQGGGE